MDNLYKVYEEEEEGEEKVQWRNKAGYSIVFISPPGKLEAPLLTGLIYSPGLLICKKIVSCCHNQQKLQFNFSFTFFFYILFSCFHYLGIYFLLQFRSFIF